MSDVDLDEVADHLYALPPEEFTAARDEAVKQVTDAVAKKAVKALRKPTAAAYVVNALVRERQDDVDELLALGDALRDAMRGDPADLRRLTERRRAVIADLVDADLSPTVQQDVTATLEAATADPQLADAVRSGRLVKPLRYAGFGAMPDLGDAVAPRVQSTHRPAPRAGTAKPTTGKTTEAKKTTNADDAAQRTQAREAEQAAARRAAELDAARAEVLELAGAADDAQRRYDAAARAAVEARALLERAETERAEAHKAARAAHDAAEKARRALGRLERG